MCHPLLVQIELLYFLKQRKLSLNCWIWIPLLTDFNPFWVRMGKTVAQGAHRTLFSMFSQSHFLSYAQLVRCSHPCMLFLLEKAMETIVSQAWSREAFCFRLFLVCFLYRGLVLNRSFMMVLDTGYRHSHCLKVVKTQQWSGIERSVVSDSPSLEG